MAMNLSATTGRGRGQTRDVDSEAPLCQPGLRCHTVVLAAGACTRSQPPAIGSVRHRWAVRA